MQAIEELAQAKTLANYAAAEGILRGNVMPKGWANPDVRTWIDAAIGLHVRDGMTVQDARTALVSQLLAEILWHCGFEPPEKWKDVGEGSLLEAARAAGTLAELRSADVAEWADATKQALEKGNWQDIELLPVDTWRWIKRLTNVDREEWQALPSYVESILNSIGRCPICGRSGTIGEIAQMMGFWQPLEHGVGSSLSVRCTRCGARLILAEDNPLQRKPPRWSTALLWSAVGVIMLLILGFGFALRFVLSSRQ